jgi:uncharacterized protein (TIGR02145 family)
LIECGGLFFSPATHFCHNGVPYALCGGSPYNPDTHKCCGGNQPYNPALQFCYSDSQVGDYCGINPQTYYNPSLYECKPSINPNGLFLKEPVTYEGEDYEAVLIGTQVWMARNLNFNATGSVCYDNTPSRCTTFGRLYDWATALGLDPICNSSNCASQVQAKHQGICPSGWHLPSDAEWTALTNYVGSPAVTKLKAVSRWYGTDNGTDDFGFSALPGGHGNSDGDFSAVSINGHWWSAKEEFASSAWHLGMSGYHSGVESGGYGKSRYLSVRCVKD